MEKAREFQQHSIFVLSISGRLTILWVDQPFGSTVLQHCYHLPPTILAIIQALHADSSAAIRAYGKTSRSFQSQKEYIKAVCWFPPYPTSIYLDTVISFALGDQQEKGVRIAYLHSTKLVGNRRKVD